MQGCCAFSCASNAYVMLQCCACTCTHTSCYAAVRSHAFALNGIVQPFSFPSWKNFRSACGRVEKSTADPHDFDWAWKLLLQNAMSFFFPTWKKSVIRLNENAFSEFWISPRSTKWSFENAFQRGTCENHRDFWAFQLQHGRKKLTTVAGRRVSRFPFFTLHTGSLLSPLVAPCQHVSSDPRPFIGFRSALLVGIGVQLGNGHLLVKSRFGLFNGHVWWHRSVGMASTFKCC